MNKSINALLLVAPLVIFFALWMSLSFPSALLFYAIYSLGMFLHITMTTLCNTFAGNEINGDADLFWKMVFLMASALSFSIYIAL